MKCYREPILMEMFRGDTMDIPLAFIRDDELVDYVSDEAVITLTVKESVKKNWVALSTVAVKNGREWLFRIRHEDTKDLDFGDYVFDVEIRDKGMIRTLCFGKFRLLGEVTV